MNQFTTFVLGEAAPGAVAVTVPDVLARAEELAGRRAAQDPGLAVDLFVSIGTVHLAHRQRDDGRRCLRRAYELSRLVADPATRATASCAWARSVAADRDLDGALRLIAEGLAFTSDDERFDGAAATCLLHRGSIALMADSSDLVTASARETLDRLDRSAAAQPDLRAAALHLAAIGQRMSGRTVEAEATFVQAFEQLLLLGRDRSSEGATLLHNWSMNAANTSPLAALETSRQVLELYEEEAEDDVPPSSLHHHAIQLIRLGRDREARPILERAQKLARRRSDGFALVMTAPQLARACRQLGDLECARSTLGAAREGLAVVPPGHRVRGDVAREEALLAEAEGRAEDVRRLLADALTIHGALKEKHLTQVETYLVASDLALRRGGWADAEARARAALDVAESFRGGAQRSSWVGRSLLALGAALQAQGDAARARELFTQALAHMTPTLGPDHPSVLEARQALAR
jgi:tetratricopeptide (TPR) repeat protein